MKRRKYRSGKARFEALGRRARSLGQPLLSHRDERRVSMPFWAQDSWSIGWFDQSVRK